MSNTFFQGGPNFSRGVSPPLAPPLVTGLAIYTTCYCVVRQKRF